MKLSKCMDGLTIELHIATAVDEFLQGEGRNMSAVGAGSLAACASPESSRHDRKRLQRSRSLRSAPQRQCRQLVLPPAPARDCSLRYAAARRGSHRSGEAVAASVKSSNARCCDADKEEDVELFEDEVPPVCSKDRRALTCRSKAR
jgi:hypothetical protein